MGKTQATGIHGRILQDGRSNFVTHIRKRHIKLYAHIFTHNVTLWLCDHTDWRLTIDSLDTNFFSGKRGFFISDFVWRSSCIHSRWMLSKVVHPFPCLVIKKGKEWKERPAMCSLWFRCCSFLERWMSRIDLESLLFVVDCPRLTCTTCSVFHLGSSRKDFPT